MSQHVPDRYRDLVDQIRSILDADFSDWEKLDKIKYIIEARS